MSGRRVHGGGGGTQKKCSYLFSHLKLINIKNQSRILLLLTVVYYLVVRWGTRFYFTESLRWLINQRHTIFCCRFSGCNTLRAPAEIKFSVARYLASFSLFLPSVSRTEFACLNWRKLGEGGEESSKTIIKTLGLCLRLYVVCRYEGSAWPL